MTLPISIADPRLRRSGGGGGGGAQASSSSSSPPPPSRNSLELTLAAGSTGTGKVLEGGVVAAAIDASGRAGFGGGGGAEGNEGGFLSDPKKEIHAAEAESLNKQQKKSSPGSSPQGDGALELRDVALYIDVAAPVADPEAEAAAAAAAASGSRNGSPVAGAKQAVTSFYGCSGSPLGTLSSFGNACGLYGSGYFGGGMLGDTSGFGGGGTIG